MLANEKIWFTPLQCFLYVLKPLLATPRIHRIHHSHLVTTQGHITIVAHAFRQLILALKQIQLGIITADIFDIFHIVFEILRKITTKIAYVQIYLAIDETK